MRTEITARRRSQLKRAYTTRNVPASALHALTTGRAPSSGDVVVARVVELGQHERLEAPDGRRVRMFVGDELLVAYGNRYAPEQYEAVVPRVVGPCDLVAAGGVAADAISWHVDKDEPTRIEVVGIVVDAEDHTVNLRDFRRPRPSEVADRPFTVVVVGTAMDAGKTTSAAGLVHGLVRRGLQVGACKVTGTGAGNDVWHLADAGALPVLDFTDAGMPSTYLAEHADVLDGWATLTGHLAHAGVDVVVVEVADGTYQRETAALLASSELRDGCDAVVFAAGDAAGAKAGVELLRELDLPVVAASGRLTASPLATREARTILDVPVLDLEQLWAGEHDVVPRATPRLRTPNRAHLSMPAAA